MVWIQFSVCAGLILIAGKRLSFYGDMIAERTGLGRAWIGVILMASVTSLPELITGISSVRVFDVPDIAVGDILGSCMFNILIISILDALNRDKPVLTLTHKGQILTGGFGLLLLGLVSISFGMVDWLPSLWWIGVYSFVFIFVYIISIRTIFIFEKHRMAEEMPDDSPHEISNPKLYWLYGFNALLVIAAATYLPHIGEEIARVTGLGQTFVGSLFIAFSTSLPEMVVSISAMRIGAVDMAVGNLMGSNLFNIGILAIDDFLYTKGPLLSNVTFSHQITAIAAAMMTTIAIIGLIYRAESKRLFISSSAIAIALVYLAATLFLSQG